MKTQRKTFLDRLVRRFVPDLEIEITPRQVSFQQGEKDLVLRPFVVLDTSGTDPRVLAVGDEPSSTTPAQVRIDIFDPELQTDPPQRKHECLVPFFRHAFLQLYGRGISLRPWVSVRPTELAESFDARARDELRLALRMVGARGVLYEGPRLSSL